MFLKIVVYLVLVYALNKARRFLPNFIQAPIRWLYAMSFELFIVLFAQLIMRPILRLFGKMAKGEGGQGIPILLVHGYLYDWTGWIYLKWKLSKEGYGPIYEIDLGNVFGSIDDYVREVGEMASLIRQQTRKNDLILIGHSMGGLVSAAYAAFAHSGKVKAVISIASPLSGTKMAHIGFIGESVKEMLPHSELTNKVQQGIRHRHEIRFFQIATKTDELIVPWTSSLVEHCDHHVVDDIGHMTLLFSPRVAAKLSSWLKEII